jgi:hypothetical protein
MAYESNSNYGLQKYDYQPTLPINWLFNYDASNAHALQHQKRENASNVDTDILRRTKIYIATSIKGLHTCTRAV